MATSAKTIKDLPHFRVSAIKVNEKSAEYFELTGILDRTEQVAEGRCSLLLPVADALNALSGYLEFINQAESIARVYTPSKEQPDVIGQSLTYVPPKWDPLHVWMVALPTWKWTKCLFQASDAIGEIVSGSGVSTVDDEEIKDWIKVKEKGKNNGLSRYFPVFPSGKESLLIEPDGTIKNAWNHSHCQPCHTHVDSGHYGYVDPSEHWVCEECYRKYVAENDLSFIFE
jgi:hypothetical protein